MPLTAEGFIPETLEEIRDGLSDDLKGEFGPNVKADDDKALIGHLVGALSERLALLNELGEAIYSSQDPDEAVGQALVAVAALTGTIPNSATKSTVTLTVTGTTGTNLVTARVVSVADTEARFATTASATLVAAAAWAPSTAYALGDRRKNGGNVYECIDAGTSAGSGGPTTEDEEITDGGVEWRFLGAGEAVIDVEAEAEDSGGVEAASGTITVIETPVSGWDGVINLLDAIEGEEADNDTTLRIRRENELHGNANAAHEAIRAAVLRVDGVTSCTVFANDTNETDADGVPAHTIEVLVRGGEDQDIWDAIFASKADGIGTYGDEEGTATGSDGREHTIRFSRPEEIAIYVDFEVLVNGDTYPEDGDDQIKQAVVDFGDEQDTGKNAVATSIGAQAFGVTGVLDTTVVHIGIASNPTVSTTIQIGSRQLATFDTSRITVAATESTP